MNPSHFPRPNTVRYVRSQPSARRQNDQTARADSPRFPQFGYTLGLGSGTLIYGTVLHLTYRDFFSVTFAYQGWAYRSPDPLLFSLALLCAFVTALLSPKHVRTPGAAILWIFNLIAVTPTLIVSTFYPSIAENRLPFLFLFLTMTYGAIVAISSSTSLPHLQRFPSPTALLVFLSTFSVLTYGTMVALLGFSAVNFTLSDVYTTRFIFRDTLASGPVVAGYLISNQRTFVNPLLMAMGVARHSSFLLAAGAIGQIYIYSQTGLKVSLYSVLVVPALCIAWRRLKLYEGVRLFYLMLVTVLAALLAHYNGASLLVNFITSRLLLIPGLLSSAWISAFDGAPKAVWGHSFLSGVVDYPYSLPPAFIVGERLTGNAAVQANVNLIGDGFANFDYFGILAEGAILGFVLLVMNVVSEGIDERVRVGAVLMVAVSVANSAANQIVLSSGALVAIIAFLLYPTRKESLIGRETERAELR